MYRLYSFLLFIALLIYAPVYFIKLKLFRGEKLHLKERLGRGLQEGDRRAESIWIHAVSVGEVLSLQELIKELRRKHPSWEINFSTLTNTGYRVAKQKLNGVDRVFFIPLDFARIIRKFFSALKPRLLVLAESEFWPNLLREARRNSCRVLLINGRISARSARRLYRFRMLTRKILENIDGFLVQTDTDKMRLEKVGVPSPRINVLGNLKSEIHLPVLTEEETASLKKLLSIAPGKKVIVAGSTHRGEETRLLDAFLKAKRQRSDVLFILAPRHPDRSTEVEKLCQSLQLNVQRKTQVLPEDSWDVLILDTVGELAQFYALSDASFVGGSLIPWGGQNLLEPAFYKKPVFFGPHMDNFASIAEEFVRAQAARVVYRDEDLVDMFLLKDEQALELMGNNSRRVLDSMQGATERTIQAVEGMMSECKNGRCPRQFDSKAFRSIL